MTDLNELAILEASKWIGQGVKIGEGYGLATQATSAGTGSCSFWIMFDDTDFNTDQLIVAYAFSSLKKNAAGYLVITDDSTNGWGGVIADPYVTSRQVEPNVLYFISVFNGNLMVNGEVWLTLANDSVTYGWGREIGADYYGYCTLRATIFDYLILDSYCSFTLAQHKFLYNNGKGCRIEKTPLWAASSDYTPFFIRYYWRFDLAHFSYAYDGLPGNIFGGFAAIRTPYDDNTNAVMGIHTHVDEFFSTPVPALINRTANLVSNSIIYP